MNFLNSFTFYIKIYIYILYFGIIYIYYVKPNLLEETNDENKII